MARVAIVTAVHRRLEVTRAFWVWFAWLREYWAPDIELIAIAAVDEAEEAHRELCGEFDVAWVTFPNHPLGARFNAALQLAKVANPDFVLVMGSDDFFDARVADRLRQSAQRRRDYTGVADMYVTDLRTGAVGYWAGYAAHGRAHRANEPAGCGRLISAALLKRLDWWLWDPTVHKGMDHSSMKRLANAGATIHMLNARALGGVMIDCKSDVNLWSFTATGALTLPPDEGKAVLESLPSEVLEALPGPDDFPV